MRLFHPAMLLLALLGSTVAHAQPTLPPAVGDTTPALVFSVPATPGDADALGVPGKAEFSLGDMGGELVLLEVIGVYCPQCTRQAPLFNNLYKRLGRKKLLGKIKMFALAAGGTPMETAKLRQDGKYAYPVLADDGYALHKLLGEPKTPFTLLLTPQGKVLFAQLGVVDDVDALYETIKKQLEEHASK